MSLWTRVAADWFETIDRFADRIKIRWRNLKGYSDKLKIVPYMGFGTTEKVFLRGRVIEQESEIFVSQADNKRRNFSNFLRRFATDEVPYAVLRANFLQTEIEIIADDEGYFNLEIPLAKSRSDAEPFGEVEFELINPRPKNGSVIRARGNILTVMPTARFGIISDLDDTVIATDVTSKFKMFVNTALRNEYTRSPFKGVAAFYAALQNGASGAENNPIFYVSSSPWNLYPLLVEFLRINRIPLGALFLKDFGNQTIFNSGDHAGHKVANIELILDAHPYLPFVLIGDSGEQDPEIYAEIVRRFPQRILVIYIRNVNLDPDRVAAIESLITEIKIAGSQLVLAPDTQFAAAHAVAQNLIAAEELELVEIEKLEDDAAATQQSFAEED